MADAYLDENGVDRYLLEDGSGVYLLEATGGGGPLIRGQILNGSLVRGGRLVSDA